MNLFVRCMSILFSGSLALVAPAVSFASLGSSVDTTTTNQAIYTHTTKDYNGCLVDNPSNPSICKPPTPADKAEEKRLADKAKEEKEKKQQQQGGQPQQGQQGQQPEQQQPEQQQQQQSQAKGGNCGDGKGTTPPANEKSMAAGDKGGYTKPGEGQKQACEQVKGSFDQRARQIANTSSSVGLTTNFSSMDKDFEEYVKNREECLSNQAEANTQCMEGNSPSTANASSGVGNVLGQVGQNASDTCGKFANAMDIAKAGLAAFSANCGKAQGSCSSSCSKAHSGLKALVQKAEKEVQGGAKCTDTTNQACTMKLEEYNSALREGIQAAQQEMDSKDPKSVAGKLKTCDGKYAANIGNALQGVMGMLAGMMQGNKCEEETDGTPEQTLGSLSDKCILPENASLPECICKANPLTVGCGSAYNKMDANNANQFSGGLTDKANVNPKGDVDSAGLDGLNGMQHAPLKDSGDVAGAPAGGGSAGLGNSNVGSGSGPGGAGDPGKSGLNANILAGTGGGGGGGKGWGAGGAGDKYRQYLPGGAKDPARNVAGQQAWTKEVTGQGGKSNWEKVKDRYRDNKGTLLNNN